MVYLLQLYEPHAEPCIGRCGAIVKFGMDGEWKGATWGNSFVSLPVDPGLHHICANWQGRAKSLNEIVALHSLNAEAGKSYFYGIRVAETGSAGGPYGFTLAPLDPDEARMLLEAYPMSKLTPKK
jgi:hypothetical protein